MKDQEGVVGEEEDESLTYGAGCTENTYCKRSVRALKIWSVSSELNAAQSMPREQMTGMR